MCQCLAIAKTSRMFYPCFTLSPGGCMRAKRRARATKRSRCMLVAESRKDGLCRAGAELPWRLRCPSQTHRRAQRACAPGATPARREPRRGNRRGPRPSATPGFNVILACPLAHPCGQLRGPDCSCNYVYPPLLHTPRVKRGLSVAAVSY